MGRFCILALIFSAYSPAQNEAALRAYFEGKTVRVKIDLPGTHDGLDVHYRQEPPFDHRSHQRRLSEWGAAVPAGTGIVVSLIHVKGKNIEFQLGGGGLNESASVSMTATVPRSRYEVDLERDIRRETDSRRRDSMRRELDRARNSREREERLLRAEKARLEVIKMRELREKAMRYGSRINLWFPANYLKESVPDPEELMRMLADYVDFSPMAGSAAAPQSPRQARLSATALRRGMEINEVHRLFGNPARFKDSKEGSISVRTEAWENNTESIEVDFAEGVALRWRVHSK